MALAAGEQGTSGTGPATLYAMLMIDALKLLLPRWEVKALESLQDINSGETGQNSIGRIEYQGELWPVFCIAADLTLITEIHPNRQVCALLQATNGFYGLICDQVAMLDKTEVQPQQVPDCMSTEDSPIHSFAIRGNEIACVVSSDSLDNFIQSTAFSERLKDAQYGAMA